MNSKVLFLLVVCAVIASPVFSEGRLCKLCKHIVDDVKKLVSAGKDSEQAIREQCNTNAPRFLKSACRQFLKGLTKLDAKVQSASPDEVCGILHVCGSSEDSDESDVE
ncbi:hypothetical protein OSTOST_20801 [Ostertagia ostertagi]